MAVQPGDIINVTKLAWDVYNAGWTHELRASTQYAQFGSEFRHLAKSLDVLSSVITKAQDSLRSHGVRASGQIRWDPASLLDIVGDFRDTLKECSQLLEDNRRYGSAPNNAYRNIEWNVLVQPTADRLRGRIQMHSSRIQSVLKPFEIDLLTRIHQDLARRIGAVHDDVRLVHSELRSLIGVLVPDLKTALEQQDALQIKLLPVPPEVELEFERIFRLHPAWQDEQHPPLRDMSDALITSLEQSTKCFRPGLTVSERIPPVDWYLNLLKCLFLLGKMTASEELGNASTQSHWPSYVKELEERLSHECDEFSRRMIVPSFHLADIDEELLHFWIEETPGNLIDTVTEKVMMEELMEIPLYTNSPSISKRIRLMRHTGTHDRKYRLVISATERQTTGRPRQEREVVDFDVTSATINPLYALSPGAPRAPYEMILQANNKIHRLAFSTLEDVFLFQQGITGFKVVDNYSEPHAKASFVIEGQGGSILEDASAQLWIHRRLSGSLVPDNSDSPSPLDTPPSPSPIPTAHGPMIMSHSPHDSAPEFGGPHHFGSPEAMSAEFSAMGLSSSPGKMSTRPGNTPPMASSARFASSPNRSQTLTPYGPFSTSPGQDSTSSGSFMSKFRRKRKTSEDLKARTLSVSSNMTQATSVTVQSNSSSDTTVTIGGSAQPRTVTVHTMPLKPMLVFFTRDAKTDSRAIVAVSVDENTIPNHQGCWCQQGASPDGKPCKITVLEQSDGKKELEARRLYSSSGQWDVLLLCANRRKDKKGFAGAGWRGLNRVSILFPDVEARFVFGGGFCTCRPQTKGQVLDCMKKGHVGLLGQVRVHYRNEAEKWYKGRYEENVHVSKMSLAGGPGGAVWKRA